MKQEMLQQEEVKNEKEIKEVEIVNEDQDIEIQIDKSQSVEVKEEQVLSLSANELEKDIIKEPAEEITKNVLYKDQIIMKQKPNTTIKQTF